MDQTPTTFRVNALHIFGLSCAAVAQPIFDILGRNAEFFVSSRSSAVAILALTIALVTGPPLALVLLEGIAGLISERLRDAVHLAIVAILLVAIALPIARYLLPVRNDAIIVVASAALGALGAIAYARGAAARQMVTWLAVLMVLAPANFVFNSEVTRLLFGARVEAVHVTVESNTPVVVIIFDELPLASLLDERLEIDAARYPQFAGLAASAYWFRNATSVSDTTTHAVPAILSGLKPNLNLLGTAHDHPKSLYSWLGHSYRVESREPATAICPTTVCADPTDQSHAARFAAMASDVAAIYGHALLPPGVAARTLPRIDQNWNNFGDLGIGPSAGSVPMPDEDGSTEDITITSNPKSLYVMHFLLPHVPWRYLPGGRAYGLSHDIPGLGPLEQWVNDPAAVIDAYQRHLLQVGYADRVLGRVLDRLRSAGVFDDALVIVAADHGCAFRPDDSRRQLTPTNWPDILRVPLLVKTPRQHSGITSDRPVQTIDILPTIASVLRAPLPFAVDGVSMLPDVERPAIKRTAVYDGQQIFPVPNDLTGLQEAVLHKTGLFGYGADTRKLFGRGRFWWLVDEPVARLQPTQSIDVRATIVEPERFSTVALNSGSVPALVAGSVAGSAIHGSEAVVAVALNGIVRGVAPLASSGQEDAFQIVVPETSFINGRNDLQILIIEGPDTHPVVSTASLTDSNHRLVSTGAEERLVSAVRTMPITPGALSGFVDRTSRTDMDGYLSVWGWVVDPQYAGPPGVLVFADGKEVASARPTADRPDIAAARADARAMRSGFVVRIPLGSSGGVRTIRVFGVSARGVASELSYPADFSYLPEMGYTLARSLGGDRLSSPTGDTVRMDPTAIQGYVDTWSWSSVDEQDYLSVSGWAVDRAKAEPISVILFAGERPVAAARPTFPRPDVARFLRDERFQQSGYVFRVAIEPQVQERRLRVLGVSAHGVASELTTSPRVTMRPAPWRGAR